MDPEERAVNVSSPEDGITSQAALQKADADLEMHDLHRDSTVVGGDEAAAPQTESYPHVEDLDWRARTANYEAAREIVARRRLEYNFHLFKRVFHYIEALDAGPSYRVFVWLPMLLQGFKLVAVLWFSHRVSRMTYLIAITYFVSWIIVDLVMITVAQNELKEDDAEAAAHLAHVWREFLIGWSGEDKLTSRGDITPFTSPSLWIVTVVNVVFAGKFAFDAGLPYIPNIWVAAVVFTCICVVTLLTFAACCMLPVPLLFLRFLSEFVWKCSWAKRCIGKPRVLREDLDWPSLFPASAAVCSAVLIFLAFDEVGPWKDSFPCWTMTTPSFYDWLG